MQWSIFLWLSTVSLVQIAYGYAEFGTVTAPCNFEPIFAVPRPKFVPEDAYIRYEPYSSSITAVAPSLRPGRNGTHETSWSLHFVQQPTHTTQTIDRGLRRRGVFSGDPPTATCRQCDKNGIPIDSDSNGTATNGSPSCSVTNYDVGVSEIEEGMNANEGFHRASSEMARSRRQVHQITVSTLAILVLLSRLLCQPMLVSPAVQFATR